MTDDRDTSSDADMTSDEEDKVADREATSAKIVHEVIRREGQEELDRPARSLAWSGLAGGIAISASLLGQSLLMQALPDTPWRAAVASIGYTLGFVIVVLGRLQLFTESTLLGVIPVVTDFKASDLGRLARLWAIVLAANLAGTFAVTLLVYLDLVGLPGHHEAMLELSRHILDDSPREIFAGAIPAGFLMAAVAWTLPAGRGQELWVVVLLTYFIALGGFTHVVAGSGEAWLLWLSGEMNAARVFGGILGPALAGNIIGGTLIFALLAHAQVADEI